MLRHAGGGRGFANVLWIESRLVKDLLNLMEVDGTAIGSVEGNVIKYFFFF